MELEVITLEDNKEYYIVKEIDNYVYLENTQNRKQIAIRKNVKIDAEDFIKNLDSEEEFWHALDLFQKTMLN